MSWVWEHSETSGSERLVLLALADSANDEGTCWPSMETIARKCRISRRYVVTIIKTLVKTGAISRQYRYKDGLRTSNFYKVNTTLSEQAFTTVSEQSITKVVNNSSLRVVNNSSHKPSFNRKVNRKQKVETPNLNDNHDDDSRADFAALIRAYETDIGKISPTLAQTLEEDLRDYGLTLCTDAIKEAVNNNVRKWAYVQAILKRWHVEGKGARKSAEKTGTYLGL